ncbi:MAG: nucleotidyl transferase AbiEii/AbiGii toxin family protein, partial [Clostridia bacterium]|nr:nucleotidyl transferase AbiEii/AbiGii toxin family protein [Clostridia bacterium]
MIRTATQLKAKVKNLSGGNSSKAQMLIRNYFMERFLERIAQSEYRDHFILKGGMLVASLVGLNTRATMDIDASVKAVSLSKEDAMQMIERIIAVDIPDETRFQISKVSDIMEDHDYPGLRFFLNAQLEKLQQTIKIDISTGDAITPRAVEYSFPLMFEDRTIAIWSYNLETLLGEKLETIMARGTANTRMRDFYDLHMLSIQQKYDREILKKAFLATSQKRNTIHQLPDMHDIVQRVATDKEMKNRWENYRKDSFYVGLLSWETVMDSI